MASGKQNAKIGILTFHFAHNYGALLQAYSLKRAFERQECEVFFIDFRPKEMTELYSILPIGKGASIKSLIASAILSFKRMRQYGNFERFIEEYMTPAVDVNEYGFLHNPDYFDALVVGSDQVWNEGITKNDADVYFFPFESRSIKCSYAASFGRNYLSDSEEARLAAYLPDFDLVTVRESSGVEIIGELGLACSLVLDPVFLTSESEWMDISRKPQKINEKYALLYSLSKNVELSEKARAYAKQNRLKLASIHPFRSDFGQRAGVMLDGIGPSEFLYLVKNASVVFTDSFHCVAFSMIFKKKLFYSFNTVLSERVKSLFDLARIDCRNRENDVQFVDFEHHPISDDFQRLRDYSFSVVEKIAEAAINE